MTWPWTLIVGVFAAGVFMCAMRAWRDELRLKARIRQLEGFTMKAQYVRNVADVRLSAIRRIALAARGPGEAHPYRRDAERLSEALRDIMEAVNRDMVESCREVGHFRTMNDAMRFLSKLPPGRDPYVFPLKMWDGDCYHVVYATKEGEPVWTLKMCDGCLHDKRTVDDPEAIACVLFSSERACPNYTWDSMAGPEPTEIPPAGIEVLK